MSRYFTAELAALEPYTPGEQPQNRQYIKLNTNESPYPPAPGVAGAVEQTAAKLALYSDPESGALVRAAADWFGVQPGNILCGNGSDENLMLAIRAFCSKDRPLAFADVTYGFYPVWCQLFGIPQAVLPLKEDFTLDPADYYGLDQSRNVGAIVIANPNAPTGLALPAGALAEVARRNPGAVVIVDEAYVDFGGESCVPFVRRGDPANLMVVQTFSKSRSLAGGRLGLCLAPEALTADLKRVKYSMNPYNVNRMTEAAGIAALADRAYFEQNCAAIRATRAQTTAALRRRGFTVLDSSANFVFARCPRLPGGELYRRLKDRGVLVRHFDAPRLADWLRITIGSPEQMQGLLKALDAVLPPQA